MTIKPKVTLIFITIFVLYGLIYWGVHQFVILPGFLSLEHEEAKENVKRYKAVITREIEYLDTLCKDWASWDNTYAFVNTRSEKYIDVNLKASTFKDRKVDSIYFLNTKGEVIWGESRDLETGNILHVDEFPQTTFPANHPLISKNKPIPEAGVKGVFMTSNGPMLVSSRPILTSISEGPVRGTLILGRMLTAEMRNDLFEQVQIPFELYPFINGLIPESVKDIVNQMKEECLCMVRKGNREEIDSYINIKDIQGNKAFLIHATTPRKISAKGYETLRYAMYLILAAGLAVLAVMLSVIHSSVLSPIVDLTRHVRSIGQSNEIVFAPVSNELSEVGVLTHEFNSMLRELQDFRTRLELAVEERTTEILGVNIRLSQEIKGHKQTMAELQTQHEQFLVVMDSIDASIYAADMETYELIFVNKHFRELFGNMIGTKCWATIQRGQKGPCTFCTNHKLLDENGSPTKPYVWEVQNTVNGKWYQCRDIAIRWPDKRFVRLEIAIDITERKLMEKQIRESLREKEVLLREIHHRVKNNMQTILSLIRIHSIRCNEEQLDIIFDDCRDRIMAMVLIHETIYQSEDLAKINCELYIKKLCQSLSQAHGFKSNKITVKIAQDHLAPNIDMSIAVGMVISELVTNAFKHAFPSGQPGEVQVTLSIIVGGEVELIVEDDGQGLPLSINISNSQSFGLQLVYSTVTHELGGSIEVDRNKGTKFISRFKTRKDSDN